MRQSTLATMQQLNSIPTCHRCITCSPGVSNCDAADMCHDTVSLRKCNRTQHGCQMMPERTKARKRAQPTQREGKEGRERGRKPRRWDPMPGAGTKVNTPELTRHRGTGKRAKAKPSQPSPSRRRIVEWSRRATRAFDPLDAEEVEVCGLVAH